MKKILFLSLFALTFSISLAAKENASENIKDPRDGKTYKTVKIGELLWMAENLNYEVEGSKCYRDSTAYCEKYGRMYNWNAAMKACPKDWFLPSNEEWKELMITVCGQNTAGKYLMATSGWDSKSGKGTDDFGFSALPGGWGYPDGSFNGGGYGSVFWSSSDDHDDFDYSITKAYGWSIHGVGFVMGGNTSRSGGFADKGFFYSVRCVRRIYSNIIPPDCKENVSTIKDPRDGKTYKTVKIGKQIWMAENMNYETEGSKCQDKKPTGCEKYGRLYNWDEAKTACPAGWHLPSDAEWNVLLKFANPSCSDSSDYAGAGTKLKATSVRGTDAYCFSALPGGYGEGGSFFYVGYYSYWWSSTGEQSANYAYGRNIGYAGEGGVARIKNNKNNLLSVRCVKD